MDQRARWVQGRLKCLYNLHSARAQEQPFLTARLATGPQTLKYLAWRPEGKLECKEGLEERGLERVLSALPKGDFEGGRGGDP